MKSNRRLQASRLAPRRARNRSGGAHPLYLGRGRSDPRTFAPQDRGARDGALRDHVIAWVGQLPRRPGAAHRARLIRASSTVHRSYPRWPVGIPRSCSWAWRTVPASTFRAGQSVDRGPECLGHAMAAVVHVHGEAPTDDGWLLAAGEGESGRRASGQLGAAKSAGVQVVVVEVSLSFTRLGADSAARTVSVCGVS